MQSGMYFDYVIKKIAEIFVRNVFIYSATFFGEKFIIEFISKKTMDNLTSFFNLIFLNRNYTYSLFYNNLIITLLFCFLFVEFYFIF
jgi:hypothetical protein